MLFVFVWDHTICPSRQEDGKEYQGKCVYVTSVTFWVTKTTSCFTVLLLIEQILPYLTTSAKSGPTKMFFAFSSELRQLTIYDDVTFLTLLVEGGKIFDAFDVKLFLGFNACIFLVVLEFISDMAFVICP